jgi:hypothetical protein
MAKKNNKAAAAATNENPILSLSEIAGWTTEHAADEFAARAKTANRLFIEQGKLVYHIRSQKLKRGQTVYGLLQSRGVSQGSVDIACKVAEVIEAVVTPGHLEESRFDSVMTFRIANRSRALLQGKGAIQLTPEAFAALLTSGDAASIGDDMECLVEHGVTVKDREIAIAAKAAEEEAAKAEAEKAAAAKAAEEEAARVAAEAEAEANKQAAAKAAEDATKARAEAEAAKAEAEKAKAEAAKLKAEAKAPTTPPPSTTTPTAEDDEDEDADTDEESDEESDEDADESDESDESELADDEEDTAEFPDTAEEGETVEAILDDLQAVIARAAMLDDDGVRAVHRFMQRATAALEAELIGHRKTVAA